MTNNLRAEDVESGSDYIYAPWTEEQQKNLNAYQLMGPHEFTCGNPNHKKSFALIAMEDGWHCENSKCQYTQQWAWAFMADPKWLKKWNDYLDSFKDEDNGENKEAKNEVDQG
jgi:hypothetical protein